jgi:hypothetical protein
MDYARRMMTLASIGSTPSVGRRSKAAPAATLVGMAMLVALPALALASGAPPGSPSPPNHEDRKSRKAARKPPPAHFSCADALDDGTVVDAAQAPNMTKLVRQLTWPEIGPAPELPPRDIRIFCGPDIDGDGDRDAIVRVSFDNPESSASEIDGALITYTVLASKHASAWRALGPLTADITGDHDVQQSVTFVRRPSGPWAVEVERSSFASETGCRITGYEVFAWRAGVLATVEAGDRSPACAPCGCDQH